MGVEFYRYTTNYEFNIDERPGVSLQRHYAELFEGVVMGRFRDADMLLACGECTWYRCGQPRYKIYPDYVDIFRRTALEVPLDQIVLPFPAFVVQLPKQAEPTLLRGVWVVESVLVSRFDGDATLREFNAWFSQADAADVAKRILPDGGWKNDERTPGNLQLIVQQRMLLEPERDRISTMTLSVEAGKTLSDTLQFIPDEHGGDATDTVRELWAVALSVAFLATGQDRLIQPDILNKDLIRYLEAVARNDKKRQQELAERADRRRGGRGFVVGREELLGRHNIGAPDEDRVLAESRRELQHSHFRKGHIHLYWTGEGRKTATLKFVPMTHVRPDLPMKKAGTGKVGEATPVSRKTQ